MQSIQWRLELSTWRGAERQSCNAGRHEQERLALNPTLTTYMRVCIKVGSITPRQRGPNSLFFVSLASALLKIICLPGIGSPGKATRTSTSSLLAYLPRRKDPNSVRACVVVGRPQYLQIPSGRVKGHVPLLTCGFISIFSFCFRCTRPCRFRSSLRANRLPHTSQENGFSPV